jgi:hypothetical protein
MAANETTPPEFKQTSTEHPVLARIGWILVIIAIRLVLHGMFAN